VFLCCLLFVRHGSAGGKEDSDALEYLKKKDVEVRYAAPLKQFWLEPEKGKPGIGQPLRVWFQGPWKPRAADLNYLPKLPQLYGVTFGSEGIKEDWLGILQELPHLKEVIIRGPNFTDECTRHLVHLKDLNSLSLTLTRVTDKGLVNLKHLQDLEFLSLVGNEGITDKGFRGLHVKNLRFLNLDSTSVTGAGITSLKDATKLEMLTLSGNLIVRRGKEYVPANAGLRHLKGLKNLKRLRIGSMGATEAEMNAVLAQNKSLPMIEASVGNYTRKGWVDAEGLPEKLKRVKSLLEKSTAK
jgi:Leucine-rich repeat (LRR) protein